MIRAVIFDCFGVLYNEGKSYLVKNCPPDRLDELKSLYYQSDYGYISRDDFLRSIASIVDMSVEEFLRIEGREYVRNQPLFDFIKSQRTNYKTGLLSNVGEGFLESLLSAKEQSELFDAVILSSKVGAIKPSKEIYEAMLSQLGLLPEECVFIDDMPANVEGANRVGMRGILFTTNHQLDVDLKNILVQKDA